MQLGGFKLGKRKGTWATSSAARSHVSSAALSHRSKASSTVPDITGSNCKTNTYCPFPRILGCESGCLVRSSSRGTSSGLSKGADSTPSSQAPDPGYVHTHRDGPRRNDICSCQPDAVVALQMAQLVSQHRLHLSRLQQLKQRRVHNDEGLSPSNRKCVGVGARVLRRSTEAAYAGSSHLRCGINSSERGSLAGPCQVAVQMTGARDGL